jgi:hypothetical protein
LKLTIGNETFNEISNDNALGVLNSAASKISKLCQYAWRGNGMA